MQTDRQVTVIDLPQFLKQEFCLRPRIDEHNRDLRPLDLPQNGRSTRQTHMPRPRHRTIRQDEVDFGHHAFAGAHNACSLRGAARYIGGQSVRVSHRG